MGRVTRRSGRIVDWTSLPEKALEEIGSILDQEDLKSAATTCTPWRNTLLGLLLRNLEIVLADVSNASTRSRARTRDSERQLLLIRKLLQHAIAGCKLELLLSERRWPETSQLATVLDCIKRHPVISHLGLQLSGQILEFSSDQIKSFLDMLKTIRTTLRSCAQPVTTSLGIDCDYILNCHYPQISDALALLPSLHHLTLYGYWLEPAHLAPFAPVTHLTSLRLHLGGWLNFESFDLQAVLQTIQHLAQLENLRLEALYCQHQEPWVVYHSGRKDHAPAPPTTLPAWPHLKHLHLQFHHCTLPNVLLSRQHCAQLQSLCAPQFHVAEGVTSMPQLEQLATACTPQRPPPPPAQHGADARQADPLPQQLAFPQLTSLSFLPCQLPGATLRAAMAMAQQAPKLRELDAINCFPDKDPAQRTELAALLARSTTLSLFSVRGIPQPLQLVRPLRRLQHLQLEDIQPVDLHLLRTLTSLASLHLSTTTSAALLQLPPQLTALTYNCYEEDCPAARPRDLELPPLRRLCLTSATTAVQKLLPLRELTSLTHLAGYQVVRGHKATLGSTSAISRLQRLAELRCRPWRGMAQQLAGLKRLRRLDLQRRLSSAEGCCLRGEVEALAALTQLRELRVFGVPEIVPGWSGDRTYRLVTGAAGALPGCMLLWRTPATD